MESPFVPRVFISSAYRELTEYRASVQDAIWRCDLFPDNMERDDVAKDVNTAGSSYEMVQRAAVYIGLFSHRYSALTVDELRWAEERRIPILIFIAEAQLNEQDVEPEEQRARMLADLKVELFKKYTVGTFRTREELRDKVYRSLVRLQRTGTIPMSAQSDSPHARGADLIPVLPAPYFAHSFVFGQQGFIGRAAELAQLDAWAGSPDPMLIVDAIGGAGKSALAWHWAHERLGTAFPHPAGVLWWSFYESNATMGSFLAHALAYLTQRPLDECSALLRSEQEEQLLAVLGQRRVALVLDGVERLLAAYHRHDAAQLTDAQVNEAPRACVDPRDGTLLRMLTQVGQSKVLLTTRLIPQDLQDRSNTLLARVRLLELPGLTTQDAIALLEAAGVHGNHERMRLFLAQFGDHALLVQVLAGRIRAYHPAPGDFDAWEQAVGRHLQLDPVDLKARQSSILAASLDDLDRDDFHLLCQIAAFRYPVDYAALLAINPFAPPDEPPPTDDQLEAAQARLDAGLTALEERGLVQWDREHNRYDLHPVVRAYAYARLEDRAATFERIRDYFERLPAEDTRQVQDVSDLRRTLELYHALLEAGRRDDAILLYNDRLHNMLYLQLGSYATMTELLSPLFPDGFARSPALARMDARAYAANELALAFDLLGELAQAQALYELGIGLRLQQHNARGVSAQLCNLADVLREAGKPAQAEHAFLLSRELAALAREQEGVDQAQQFLMTLYADIGAWTKGEAAYAALQASPDEGFKNGVFTLIYAAQLRWGQGQNPHSLLVEAVTRAHEERHPRAEREARQLQGQVAFTARDLPGAEEAWLAAHAIAQLQGTSLGPTLADLARLRARQALSNLARQLISEALAAGGVGPIELAAAEVYVALGDTDEAKRHIVPAYQRAWADGSPYSFYFEMQRARAVLAALAMPEPELPPYDAARIPPLPDEVAIRAFIAELEAERQRKGEQGASDVRPSNSVADLSFRAAPRAPQEPPSQPGEPQPAPELPPSEAAPSSPPPEPPLPAREPVAAEPNWPWWRIGRRRK